MVKFIRVLSDLHLEFGLEHLKTVKKFYNESKAKYTVLGGDITNYKKRKENLVDLTDALKNNTEYICLKCVENIASEQTVFAQKKSLMHNEQNVVTNIREQNLSSTSDSSSKSDSCSTSDSESESKKNIIFSVVVQVL